MIRALDEKQLRKHWDVIRAWLDGKTIECRLNETHEWEVTATPLFHIDYEYRVKPEPKFRPWKAEEVPVGAVIKDKREDHFCRSLILGSCARENTVQISHEEHTKYFSFQEAFDSWEYSLDQGKTWHPCGVQE
jgi:hypothetical protein